MLTTDGRDPFVINVSVKLKMQDVGRWRSKGSVTEAELRSVAFEILSDHGRENRLVTAVKPDKLGKPLTISLGISEAVRYEVAKRILGLDKNT